MHNGIYQADYHFHIYLRVSCWKNNRWFFLDLERISFDYWSYSFYGDLGKSFNFSECQIPCLLKYALQNYCENQMRFSKHLAHWHLLDNEDNIWRYGISLHVVFYNNWSFSWLCRSLAKECIYQLPSVRCGPMPGF